jgi:dihydroorotate dehydrogenase electron transfer subunit
LGPLGNGFPDFTNKGNLLLVSGGVGIAPLISLAESLGSGVSLIAGGKVESDVSYIADNVEELGINVKYATEDGSMGQKGTSVSVMREMVTPNDTVCACGPFGMLVEVQKLSVEIGFSAYVSCEEKMGCGVGLCFGCVISGVDGEYLLVCKDGPVFNVQELSWDRIT